MERESFEDTEVAQLLNDSFIPIKVDKEERPDVDSVYMTVCQAMTGQGGWPLTIIMTPEQKPFFAGTYFPKNSRYNMPGLVDILQTAAQRWKENKVKLLDSGEQITNAIKDHVGHEKGMTTVSQEIVTHATGLFEKNFDKVYGGFGKSPKFPSPHNIMFLLRYAVLHKDDSSLKMAEKTLQQMYKGGIFDHIGYGFCRYSTDDRWLVPHFEKMLYDNALLTITYLEAYQITGKSLYKEVAEKTLKYISREMTSPAGGFYCAQDADSEGEEGKFYTLTPFEVEDVLGKEDGRLFCSFYDITPEGNFEKKSIPNLINNPDFEEPDVHLTYMMDKLYEYRLKRTALHKDDKILTSWNSLMIAALAKAYKILGKEEYLSVAKKALEFILDTLTDKEGNLQVRYRDGHSIGNGNLDDYAYFVWALTEMYEASYEENYLKIALDFNEKMLTKFRDEKSRGFFLTADDSENLIFRPKESYDGAMPSGNSVASYNLARLAKITGSPELEEEAYNQISYLYALAEDFPIGYSFALIAIMMSLYPSNQAVCVADRKEDAQDFIILMHKNFLPNTVSLLKYKGNAEEISQVAGYLEPYSNLGSHCTYYLCRGNACSEPVTDINILKQKL